MIQGPTEDAIKATTPGLEFTNVSQPLPESDDSLGRYAKLRTLAKLIDAHANRGNRYASVFAFLQVKNDLATYKEALYNICTLKDCLESFRKEDLSTHWSRSNDTAIPKTQWENHSIAERSSILYEHLRGKIEPSNCDGHLAYLRLNGFDLERTEKQTFFDLFLSFCFRISSWREGRCTSIHR